MALTDNSDIFASMHEDGFRNIIKHVRQQRPSLFNYATQEIANNKNLICKCVETHPIITVRNNPVFTIMDPLPIPGTEYGLNYAIQVVDLEIDFHPGDDINLPDELSPPLKEQKLALKISVCGGIACPSDEVLDKLVPEPKEPVQEDPNKGREKFTTKDRKKDKNEIIPLPSRKINCFCLNAYAVGGIRITTYNNKHYLEPYLDGIEIVDIKPTELENSIECYIRSLLKLSVLPGLRFLLEHAPLDLTQGASEFFTDPTNVSLVPAAESSNIPNNPAIEKDQVKAFINMEVM